MIPSRLPLQRGNPLLSHKSDVNHYSDELGGIGLAGNYSAGAGWEPIFYMQTDLEYYGGEGNAGHPGEASADFSVGVEVDYRDLVVTEMPGVLDLGWEFVPPAEDITSSWIIGEVYLPGIQIFTSNAPIFGPTQFPTGVSLVTVGPPIPPPPVPRGLCY